MSHRVTPPPVSRPQGRAWYGGLVGAFFGLTLLKFGNPPIMEQYVTAPENCWQLVLGSPWPITWAYALLAAVTAVGLFGLSFRWPRVRWPMFALLVWFVWQFVSTTSSVDVALSRPTVAHFAACVACFIIGCFCLPPLERLRSFFAGLLIGYLFVLAIGFQQQFGGLEATRQHFFAEIYPQLKQVSPDYIKKVLSSRIFSTLFYPNTLAGVLILLMPPLVVFLAEARRFFTAGARWFLVCIVLFPTLACLVWSGSKGGWLVMLFLGLLALLQLRFSPRLKVGLVCAVLVAGGVGFVWKYHGFFQKGATSVVARFDYWSAAIRTAASHPVTGTGPGTFARPYSAIKRPESEMARLAHNDYLEQASDSGLTGFLAYAAFVGGCLYYGIRGVVGRWSSAAPGISGRDSGPSSNLGFAVCLGTLGWAIQGLFEFGLYVPALAWPAFCFLGLLLRSSLGPEASPEPAKSVDKGK